LPASSGTNALWPCWRSQTARSPTNSQARRSHACWGRKWVTSEPNTISERRIPRRKRRREPTPISGSSTIGMKRRFQAHLVLETNADFRLIFRLENAPALAAYGGGWIMRTATVRTCGLTGPSSKLADFPACTPITSPSTTPAGLRCLSKASNTMCRRSYALADRF